MLASVPTVDGRREDVRELVGIITEELEEHVSYEELDITVHENENDDDIGTDDDYTTYSSTGNKIREPSRRRPRPRGNTRIPSWTN